MKTKSKTLENQYLVEYRDKLNAYQEKLDAYQEKLDVMQFQMIPISRADEREFYRLLEIVQRLETEQGDES